MQDDAERLREWLAEAASVRLLARGWSIGGVSRATGVPHDILRHYARRLKAYTGDLEAFIGPPPRKIDRICRLLRPRDSDPPGCL